MLCIKKCPTGALTAGNPELAEPVQPQGIWINPVSRTHISTCAGKRVKAFCHGLCIAVCPVGNFKAEAVQLERVVAAPQCSSLNREDNHAV